MKRLLHEIEIPLYVVPSLPPSQVVCRKLRSDHSESQHQQHLKAAKALFIIIPLLGMPYLITLLPPTDETSYFFIFFQHTRAVLLATQVS